MVQKYSTLPLEIEAIQLEESIDSIDEVLIFMGVSIDDQYRRTLIAATALRDGGLIERVGSDRKGYWKILVFQGDR